jgi:hypothetical protein
MSCFVFDTESLASCSEKELQVRGHPKRTSANEREGRVVWPMRTHVLILPLKGRILWT